MILVIVRRDERVNLGDPGLIHHGLDALAMAVLAAVDQETLAVGHNHQSAVRLLHVNMVDAQCLRRGIGAAPDDGYRDKEGCQSQMHF